MRKFQKQQCLDMVSVLAEAHAEIRKHIERKQTKEASELLADCQQGAIGLGNLIEELEGGDAAPVHLIEAYCELAYQVYEAVSWEADSRANPDGAYIGTSPEEGRCGEVRKAGNRANPEETNTGTSPEESHCEEAWEADNKRNPKETNTGASPEKNRRREIPAYRTRMQRLLTGLDEELKRVGSSIWSDIPVREEIVFLPYKASMWDSLESVWRAAEEDPNCDAYVIPIPYYDKNPDGSFREMHYEGDRFPKDVPVVKYDAYDFATRRPDKVYIHNPYDNDNHVTSVHPAFYSSNLKKYTDCLIYIPYFVLDEPDLTKPAALKGLKKFVLVSCMGYADRVIVQSENMRRAYIEVLTGEFGRETRSIWQKKISGTGSPKIDRVRNLREEDYALPEAWERLIRKADGSRRKVILYNTAVDAMMKQGEKMLAKIRSVLKIFYDNREDIILLWRPHPLMEATLRSMRPEIWPKYENIIEDYRGKAWGIYDDSPELERAIAISDAYYGDRSSVVRMYRETGKPVMIQNTEIGTDGEKAGL